ncbi:spore coat protein SP96-like isoform X2 [Topomyia yanbarensis]|uniref:spore coat protein SP96-like isoform X2 n=1 Tax=Topomyia yanbarensis TaxID=2498891 RepID=UPI00273B9A70|nr:spore coat protein SP96-like isoform X2 [Topomyia yanbarensis]
MVSIMDIEPKRQICDNRSTLSQSAVSQKSIDLEIPIPLKSPTATTSPTSPTSGGSGSGGTLSPTTATSIATDTELAKRAMKLNLIESQSNSAASAGGTSAASTTTTTTATTTTHSSTSNSAATTTTAVIMKHRKLKERTFSDELGSPKSPAAAIDVVDDRKALRDALYQGIFHRHRRTIFAVGSFLRMLKSRSSSYNTIRSSSEGEDDTR